MKRVRIFIRDCALIFNNPFLSLIDRVRLFFSYLIIRLKRTMHYYIPSYKPSHCVVLGMKINFNDLNDFFWSFKDVYVDHTYFFMSDKEAPAIVDCGSNIGTTVLLYAYLNPGAHITAFEPDPYNVQLLKKNVDQNGVENIQIIEKAVAETEGSVSLYGTGRAVTTKKELHAEEYKEKASTSHCVIETVLLSEYVSGGADYIKIDIEGAEVGVLKELHTAGVLEKIKKLVIEFHEYNQGKFRLSEALSCLEEAGFTVWLDYGMLTPRHLAKRDTYHFMIVAFK